MSKSNTAENDLLLNWFNSTALSWVNNGSLYVALHTADPGEAGNQNTNEATYTSYTRVGISRSASGWTISGNQATNTAIMLFPQCTGGTNILTHVSIGSVLTGGSQMMYSGSLNSSLTVSNLIQPQFAAGALTVTED